MSQPAAAAASVATNLQIRTAVLSAILLSCHVFITRRYSGSDSVITALPCSVSVERVALQLCKTNPIERLPRRQAVRTKLLLFHKFWNKQNYIMFYTSTKNQNSRVIHSLRLSEGATVDLSDLYTVSRGKKIGNLFNF